MYSIYIYVLATNSKTKVPLILPIVKEPSITRGNEIFNIHLVALLIYDPDLQVYTLQGYKRAFQKTDD